MGNFWIDLRQQAGTRGNKEVPVSRRIAINLRRRMKLPIVISGPSAWARPTDCPSFRWVGDGDIENFDNPIDETRGFGSLHKP